MIDGLFRTPRSAAEQLQAQQNAWVVERRDRLSAMPRIIRKGGSVPEVRR